VSLSSAGVPALESSAPVEFGGPGDRWSPEGLLVAAVLDCLSLSFRAIAGASSLAWNELQLGAEATLDRVDKVMRFSEIRVDCQLRVPRGTNVERAERLLQRAEASCPISNSLKTPVHLDVTVVEV
jgi:organic hydroperoxide reductase OsmC/OhrA